MQVEGRNLKHLIRLNALPGASSSITGVGLGALEPCRAKGCECNDMNMKSNTECMVAKRGHHVSSQVDLWNCARFLLNVPMLKPDM